MQIEKKRIVAPTRSNVSERRDVFGNLSRRKRSNPNSSNNAKLNHSSSGEYIRPNDGRTGLKNAERQAKEFPKKS